MIQKLLISTIFYESLVDIPLRIRSCVVLSLKFLMAVNVLFETKIIRAFITVGSEENTLFKWITRNQTQGVVYSDERYPLP